MPNLFAAATFITAVQALAFDGKLPKPTSAFELSPTTQQPEITKAPDVRELAKRQNGQTVLIGPDNTCGFVDGRAGAAYSCNGASVTCALVTTSSVGAVACCDDDECGIRVDCVDYIDFYSRSACNNGCVQDTFTVKCTNILAPYCGTVTFFSGIVDYYCDTLTDSTPQQLYTTYSGERDGRSFTPVVVTLSGATSIGNSVGTGRTLGSGYDDATSTDADSSTATTAGSRGGSTTGSSGSSGSKSSTNIGAIVGGVVGGVVALALIGLGIFFLVRHNQKKKQAAAAAAAAAGQQMQQGPGGHNGPAQPPGTYNPHLSHQFGQAPPAYPPAAGVGFYADGTKPGGFTDVTPAQLPDRNASTSPVSVVTDGNGRQSLQPSSPASTTHSQWQAANFQTVQQQSPNIPLTVHEAGGNVVGERDYNSNHHGQFHELG
ncbi:hypothetical protein F5B20DRAFT_576550 [Whalleya microplaca]|nr:hypothetical protein F5B20DRAFT_576550 [Whalleya microplaca]